MAAGRPPRHGTARATPTRIANAAIPALSRRNGHGNGFAKQCAHGERATALRRPRTIGRARTHVGAAATRSNDYMPENGPRRPLSSVCTGLGRRPSATPSAAHERLGVKCRWHRDPRLHLVMCEQERRRSPRRFCHSCVGEARRRELAVVCQQPPVVRSPQFGDRRRSRPPGPARPSQPWQRHRRLAAVGTIALRQCDRRAGGAVRGRRTAEFGRRRKRVPGRRRPDLDERLPRKRSSGDLTAPRNDSSAAGACLR